MRPGSGLALALIVLVMVAIAGLGLLHSTGRLPGDRPQAVTEPSSYDRVPLQAELAAAGLALGRPVHIRIFKAEAVLEAWLAGEDGRYRLFKTYPICTFSGELGPKLAEGDRQAPEGFYKVSALQLNPNSRHHLAFNLGFPNAYDRQLGRTGSFLMVHGGCSSVGCYAMTDPMIDEIYAMVEAAQRAGQAEVDVHAFPFRLTAATLAAQADSPWHGFWANLGEGAARFEATGRPPEVYACNGRYVFEQGAGCEPIRGWRA